MSRPTEALRPGSSNPDDRDHTDYRSLAARIYADTTVGHDAPEDVDGQGWPNQPSRRR